MSFRLKLRIRLVGNSRPMEHEALQHSEFGTRARSSVLWRRASRSWLGEFWREGRRFVYELCHWARREDITLPSLEQLGESIAWLDTHGSDTVTGRTDTEAPIFLVSTGWRTGSTLLQRILVTDPRLFLWGEPLSHVTIVSTIAEMVNDLRPRDLKLWYTQPNLNKLNSSWLATSWIANLYPYGDDFRSALRSLFDRWLGEPTRQRGFARWGLKEVRLGAVEASLLYWLYPNAKFVMISRHPYDCYVSLCGTGWRPVYHRRPTLRVDSVTAFARYWNRLAVGWSQLPEGFPSFHVKYEDLVNGKVDFRKLESWLGIEIRENIALSLVVGHSSVRPRPRWYERRIIACEAAPGMRALGYPE